MQSNLSTPEEFINRFRTLPGDIRQEIAQFNTYNVRRENALRRTFKELIDSLFANLKFINTKEEFNAFLNTELASAINEEFQRIKQKYNLQGHLKPTITYGNFLGGYKRSISGVYVGNPTDYIPEEAFGDILQLVVDTIADPELNPYIIKDMYLTPSDKIMFVAYDVNALMSKHHIPYRYAITPDIENIPVLEVTTVRLNN